jgi:penicillin-binding protein 1C
VKLQAIVRRLRSGLLLPRVLVAGAMAVQLALLALAATAVWRARLSSPPPTVFLEDRHGAFLAEVTPHSDEETGYWPVDPLPPRVVAATVALEDRRFWSHPGVDPLALGRAAWQDVTSLRRVSGASTLAMQVARMQAPGARTLTRKAVEALTALILTARYGREAVLAHYLRLAPYGNRIHGIAYAARRYFDKPVADLSWAEIAFLAALPQAPGRMNPFIPSGWARAVARGQFLLGRLRDEGVVSAAEFDLARSQLAHLRIPERETRPLVAIHEILRLEAMLRRGAAPVPRGATLVRTTLDLGVQREVGKVLADSLDAWEAAGAGNAAAMVVDAHSGEVLACLGSGGYFDTGRVGAIDYTRIARSPGSTLKPFIYALALELGTITPATILDDLDRGPGGIVNADADFLGPLLPRVALANSRNVPAVELLARVGIDEGFAFLADLGLHDGGRTARSYGLGLAVGGMPVTLERLVRAYTALAGDGWLADLVWLRGAAHAPPRRVLRKETAREVTLFLADPLARLPTFPRMGASEFPFPVAIKTGSSQAGRDAWAMAYSTRYLVGVWVGRADFRSMSHLTGYDSAAHAAHRILTLLHPGQTDGLADLSFPPPEGFRGVRVCALTGKAASTLCGRVFTEWFRPGAEPVARCTAHLRVAVDTRTGRVASSRTPSRFVEVETMTALPPRYAAWAAGHGVALAPAPLARAALLGQGIADAGPVPLPSGRGGDAAARAEVARVRVSSPRSGTRLLRDPETPPGLATVALQAVVDPPVPQVVWYVDGAPFAVADYPYVARWPLASGVHTFQVRLPFSRIVSSPARVSVE